MSSNGHTGELSTIASLIQGIVNKALDLDSNHRVLGNTLQERQSAYKEYVTQTIPDEELHLIRQAIQRNQLTGSDRFRMYLEKKHKVVISNRGQGRPKKAKK
jgi:putative transposase